MKNSCMIVQLKEDDQWQLINLPSYLLINIPSKTICIHSFFKTTTRYQKQQKKKKRKNYNNKKTKKNLVRKNVKIFLFL